MSSSSAPAQGRMVHQDFIARIRFSNALPPPPLPPKLLDMPGSGLASGQYTTPGFASRLAREQPLNIEADAELGMPLDLIGIPGVFDGDESAIQAPAVQPPVHPNDRPLLRPLSTLGRPKAAAPAVSFLRRTEYISSLTPTRASGSSPRALINKAARTASHAAAAAAAIPEPDKDSPAAIRRHIDDAFAATARLLADPSRLRHPNPKKRANPNIRCVDALPLLPDLDAFPDSGAFVVLKFATPPMPGSTALDPRLSMSLLRPVTATPAEEAAHQAAVDAWQLDPQGKPRPSHKSNYEFFLGAGAADARNLRAKLDVDNPDRDNDALYTRHPPKRARDDDDSDAEPESDEKPCFRFKRLRTYETAGEIEFPHERKYDTELLIALNDGGSGGGDDFAERAAYFYPVLQRTAVRSQRAKNILRRSGLVDADGEQEPIDSVDVSVTDPDARMRDQIAWFKENPRTAIVPEEAHEEEGEGVREDEEIGRENGRLGGSSSPKTKRDERDEDEDEETRLRLEDGGDAEGDDADGESEGERGTRREEEERERSASPAAHTSDEE